MSVKDVRKNYAGVKENVNSNFISNPIMKSVIMNVSVAAKNLV